MSEQDGVQTKCNSKRFMHYTEEDTGFLWFAQVLEKLRVVVQGGVVCDTHATAANVGDKPLVAKIR